MSASKPFFIPQWPAPTNIKACSTLRYPGQSTGNYAEFNLATHVGDDLKNVQANRDDLMIVANLPSQPKWLNQTHTNQCILAEDIQLNHPNPTPLDASHTRQNNIVCVVMTADCLPILVTNKAGTEIAAIHAGWKGLTNGVVENTLSALNSEPESLMVWIGPSISKPYYEVGEDVYDAFARYHTVAECEAAFTPNNPDHSIMDTYQSMQDIHQKKWLVDVPLLAQQRLIRLGIEPHDIYLSGECTYAKPDRYFSFRRDNITGRMASLIWMEYK